MQLADYLSEKRLSYTEFASLAGLSVPSIWKIAHGKAKPTLDTMLLIEKVSDGAVTAQDFAHQHGGSAPEVV